MFRDIPSKSATLLPAFALFKMEIYMFPFPPAGIVVDVLFAAFLIFVSTTIDPVAIDVLPLLYDALLFPVFAETLILFWIVAVLYIDTSAALLFVKSAALSPLFVLFDILIFSVSLQHDGEVTTDALSEFSTVTDSVTEPVSIDVDCPVLFPVSAAVVILLSTARSEERRVGKEGRSRWSPYH